MIRITGVIPGSKDTTSFFRGVGPFEALCDQYTDIRFRLSSVIDWTIVKSTDLFFMQRPASPEELAAIVYIKKTGVPIWIDYDDNLLEIPKDNPCYEKFQGSVARVAQALYLADITTVSTPVLREAFGVYSKNIKLIPNALDDMFFGVPEKWERPPEKRIVWRGSNTHVRDLYEVKDEIVEVANSNLAQDWKWTFFGYNPWFITEQIPSENLNIYEAQDIVDYYEYLKCCAASAFIVPLSDNAFNRSKSNNALMEASFAGATCIASDLPEFNAPGCITFNGGGLKSALEHHISNFGDADRGNAKKAMNYFKDGRLLSQTNELRKNIILELTQ